MRKKNALSKYHSISHSLHPFQFKGFQSHIKADNIESTKSRLFLLFATVLEVLGGSLTMEVQVIL